MALLAAGVIGAGERALAEEELSPAETIALLAKIESLRKEIDESRFGEHATAIQAFRSASASPDAAYDFYVKCYKLVKFERRGARESEYREWRTKNAQWLRSKEHSEARRLQLEYLVITLRAAQADREEFEKLLPELSALVDVCVSRSGSLGRAADILRDEVNDCVFAEAYALEPTIKRLTNWGAAPLDLEGIYEKAILPVYRSEEKADDLAEAWDRRISQRMGLVAASDNEDAERRFSEYTLPLLRWNKNIDLLKAGQRRTAINAMVELIQKNVDHQDVDDWITALSSYLKGEEDLPAFDDDKQNAF